MTDDNINDSNIKELKFEKDASMASIEAAKRNLENINEMVKIMAKIRKQQYDAYVAEGFTASQAMEMVIRNANG